MPRTMEEIKQESMKDGGGEGLMTRRTPWKEAARAYMLGNSSCAGRC